LENRPRVEQPVQNSAEARDKQTGRILREVLLPARTAYFQDEITAEELDMCEQGVFSKLTELYAPEIFEAILENPAGRLLCRVQANTSNRRFTISGDQAILRGGVRRAVSGVTQGDGRPMHECVKAHVADVLVENTPFVREWVHQGTSAELVALLLRTPPLTGEALISFMATKQAAESLGLLIAPATFYQPPFEQEPNNRLDWLARCLYTRVATDPGVQHVAENSAKQGRQVLLLVDPDGRLKPTRKQDGEPPDLAGPLHVKMSGLLSKQLSKRADFPLRLGNVNKAELGGISNMAKSLKVSRSRVRGWREREDELAKVYQDDNGVSVNLTADDIWRIAEIACNHKPQHS
jgi:hypothetical protein